MPPSSSVKYTLLFTLLLIAFSSCCCHGRHILLSALDDGGLKDALAFVSSLDAASAAGKDKHAVTLFVHKVSLAKLSTVELDAAMGRMQDVKVFTSQPLPDHTRNPPKQKEAEMISYLIESLLYTAKHVSSGNASTSAGANTAGNSSVAAGSKMLLTLVFKAGVKVVPAKQFSSLWDHALRQADVLMLAKNRALTSTSDWHDLVVLGLNLDSPVALAWLETFREVYLHHAQREAFTLLEPRPALLQANSRFLSMSTGAGTGSASRPNLRIRYLGADDVRRVGKEKEGEEGEGDGQLSSSAAAGAAAAAGLHGMLELHCAGHNKGEGERCLVGEPQIWKRRMDRMGIPRSYFQKVKGDNLKLPDINTSLPHAMWDGSLRFFKAADAVTPRRFCWEKLPSDPHYATENKVKARIVYNATHAVPYEHRDRSRSGGKMLTAVFLTGMEANAHRLDEKMYINLAKMAYCKRHGYKFLQLSSNQYRHYYDPFTFISLNGGGLTDSVDTNVFRGYMSKVPMILSALLTHPNHEWLVWTDDDVYINPGWSYLPMDTFLGPDVVPADKVFVAGNYRSAFTNIFAIRNNAAGRRLAIDWLSVAQSGHIECHGYDQAALQLLILLRIQRSMSNPRPFNHTCLHTSDGDTGCNMKGDWSCDFDFERSLYFAGFKAAMQSNFFDLRLSTYTKACANENTPEFHVITESNDRPRLQCGHCTRLDQVFSSGHWDGPLGGGNDKIRRGGIDGWFTNHKAEFLFWEGHLEPTACAAVEGWIQACNASTSMKRHPKDLHLVNLVDGYAFDLDQGTYCRVSDPDMLAQQRHTYTKDYPILIAAGSGYSDEQWWGVYRNFSGGEGRAPCQGKVGPGTSCDHGQGADGQKQKKAMTEENENDFLERPNYCQGCLSLPRLSTSFANTSSGSSSGNGSVTIMVTDCRLDKEVIAEHARHDQQLHDAHDLRAHLWGSAPAGKRE